MLNQSVPRFGKVDQYMTQYINSETTFIQVYVSTRLPSKKLTRCNLHSINPSSVHSLPPVVLYSVYQLRIYSMLYSVLLVNVVLRIMGYLNQSE